MGGWVWMVGVVACVRCVKMLPTVLSRQRRGNAQGEDDEIHLTVAQVALHDREEDGEEHGEQHGDCFRPLLEIGSDAQRHAPDRPHCGEGIQREPGDQRHDGRRHRERDEEERERRRIQIGKRRGQQVGTCAVRERSGGEQVAGEIDAVRTRCADQRLPQQHGAEQRGPGQRDSAFTHRERA